jgi:hypothetical protein
MQVNVLNRKETYRIRDFSLDPCVEEKGEMYTFNIILIGNYGFPFLLVDFFTFTPSVKNLHF